VSESDTSFKVIYINQRGHVDRPAYFLNGKFISGLLLKTLNPKQIDSISIIADSIQIDSTRYPGQVHIKTNRNYIPQLISLTDLKARCTNLKGKSAIFMIDGDIINVDYDKYMVDESYLLTIIIDKVENKKEKIDLGIINLLTKSELNIKKSRDTRIRGSGLALVLPH
jgi:hypothetical protein